MARKKVINKINLKPVRISNKDLQTRIDMVVEKALQRESKTQHDVIRHVNHRLRFVNAQKLG
jgi:hypothetical protein